MTRVLHVVGVMNRAGTETWLMHLLRNTRNSDLEMDFLVHSSQVGDYDEEIHVLGRKIKFLSPTRNPIAYSFGLYKLLASAESYDVIHSHVHHFSGWVMLIARLAGIKIRIAHSHNDTSKEYRTSSLFKRVYLKVMEALIRINATCGLAASQLAGKALYGDTWHSDSRWKVLHCGIDFKEFSLKIDRVAIRLQLGIDSDAFVVGHVGRFVDQKNHRFIIEVFEQLKNIKKNAHLLLVGIGPLLEDIKEVVKEKGLQDSVTFAGIRKDVPQLMKGGMDIFIFPSKFEGLGLVLVEAQEAMLPCIISNVVPDEVAVSQVTKLALDQTANDWATTINLISENPNNFSNTEKKILTTLLHERFSIDVSISSLISVYKNES
jgi:glycosyltransferase involved in cell wall biosynthesis